MPPSYKGLKASVLMYFTRHKTAANLLLLVMIFSGVVAFPQMRAQFFPDVVFDSVSVSVQWNSAGAEDIDASIVQRMIPVLQEVEGVTGTLATSMEGRANIVLEFEPDWDIDRAVDEIESALGTVNDLPEDVETPTVVRRSWRDRVTDVIIHGPVSVDLLSRLADEFVFKLFEDGVSKVNIRGIEAPRTIVTVPEAGLVRHNVTLSEIASAIGEEANTKPTGEVGGSSRVRTGIEKRTPEEITQIFVRTYPDGSKLLVGDLARVTIEGVDRKRAYFVGDEPAVSINVERSGDGDAIELQQKVEAIAEEIRLSLPQGVEINLIRTRAEAITNRLNLLYKNGLIGLGLVVVALFLFLNARTAFWVAAGVPTAMFAAIALMYVFGFTLNMISMFALIITLGLVVDDAIVVGEHADFRFRRLGESPLEAAENAAIIMAAPVFAASVTTIIAFFGIITIGGRFGSLLIDLPFTVIVVLAASLLECFLVLPHHMKNALSHSQQNKWYDMPSRFVDRIFQWLQRTVIRPFITAVVYGRYVVIATAVLILAWQLTFFLDGKVNWRFFNAPELGSVSGNFAMTPGASRSDSTDMMKELQRSAEAVGKKFEDEHGQNPITFAIAEVGGSTGRGLFSADSKDGDLLGSIAIELIDADLRPYSSFSFVAELQDEVRRHPLLETLSFRGGRRGPGGDALDVKLFGNNIFVLKDAAEKLKSEVSTFAIVSAVEDDLAYDKEELVLTLTAQGEALGFTIDGLARILRDRLSGITAATFPVGTRLGEIFVQLPDDEMTADYLEGTMIRSPDNNYILLSDIVRINSNIGFSTIRRDNGVRVVSVTGDISEDDPNQATEFVQILKTEILPQLEREYGVSFVLSGLAEQEQEFLNDARLGFSLVMLGIFMTLVWVLSSWTKPLIVLITIPFGLVGAIWGHYLWNIPLSMFSVIGLVGMSGIIINDSIVLISTINLYSRTRSMFSSIVDATCDRFRPVMLTTMTTILGLLPLLYETSQQASFLKPTVITLTYGLGFGFFLVLLLIPALLQVHTDMSRLFVALRRSLTTGRRNQVTRIGVGISVMMAILLFVATIGVTIVNGNTPLLAIMPTFLIELVFVSPKLLAYFMFVIGMALICLTTFLLTVYLKRRSQQV